MANSAITLNSVLASSRFAVISRPVGLRLARGVAWTALGSSVAQGGSLLCAVIVARLVGKGLYGQYAFILSTAIAITSVAGLGLGFTATKYVSQYRLSDTGKAGRILGLSSSTAVLTAGSFAVAMALFAPSLISGNVRSELVAWGLRWSAIYVYFTAVNAYQVGAMAGFEAFGAVAAINGCAGAAIVVLTWCLAAGAGFKGAVLAQGAGAAVLWTLYHFALRKQCRKHGIAVSCRGAWRERAVLFHFSLPSAACGIVAAFAVWFGNTTVVGTRGYAELAVFSAVYNLRPIVLFVPALVGRVTLPLLNSLLADGQGRAYRRTLRASVVFNGAIALGLAVCLFAGGTPVLRLFGKDFAGAPGLFAMVLGSAVLEVIASCLFQSLFTSGRIWRNLAINCVWAGVLAGSAKIAAGYGAAGLAFSYLMASGASVSLYGLAASAQCRTGRR